MSQLFTLIWLKWKLFRNSLRSSKAVVNRIASALAMLAALVFALVMALGLGIAAYALTSPALAADGLQALQRRGARGVPVIPSAEFMFFSILSMSYLLWATLPLSIGASRHFDPGNLLLYPISFRKLFAVDFVSEIASLQAVFAIPSVIAIGVGAGLAQAKLGPALVVALFAAAFGVSLSKWVSSSIGSLIRKKRTRGETLLALIGAVAGLGGILFVQMAPVVFRHTQSITALRWTPPGAIAFALTQGLRPGHSTEYAVALTVVGAYTAVLVAITYWLARRAVLGGGTRSIRRRLPAATPGNETYTGWELPFVSPELSAVIEKELRYATRNAQLRMMALMPLILIAVRLMNRRGFDQAGVEPGSHSLINDFLKYGEGLLTTAGILYVFLVLTGVSCNLFAFEHAGMRTLVLSPIDRKKILLGKNIAISVLALALSIVLLVIEQLVFGNLNRRSLLFAGLCFLIFAALMSVLGNWFSIRFPKRMKIGRRLNVSGVVGLLLIPMIAIMAIPPLAAVAAGFVAQSLLVEYVTLAVLVILAIALYVMVIKSQGESLQQRELEILEAVTDPGGD